ncbi:hypothetical protein AB0L75_00025 [Streptomyces sp. NPDC052101]|uniref:hypothetical protein n=1 Tax=Streptomyces sp. NPDC052101 TaxID=3155763 RepID=UPI00343B85FC
MTALFDASPLPDGDGDGDSDGGDDDGGGPAQCAGHGVNVGRNVYGGIGIHIHTAPTTAPPVQRRHRQASPVSAARHAYVLARLAALSRACGRAMAAMSALGPTRPDRRQR